MYAEIIIRRDDGTLIVHNVHPIDFVPSGTWYAGSSGPFIEGQVCFYGYDFALKVNPVPQVPAS